MSPDSGSELLGFRVLFGKEMAEARRSKRAIAFVLLMTVILLMVPIIGYFRFDEYGTGGRHVLSDEDMAGAVQTWAGLVAYIGSLMVIASTVDALTRERSLGITAWIVTKPVSRLSYLSAKALSHAAISAISVVIVPTIIWLVVMTALFQDVPYGSVVWSSTILLLEVGFLSFAVVALGVPLQAVVWIALVSLGFWFIPTAVPAIQTLDWTYRVLPSYLPVAAILATDPQYATSSEVFTISIASIVIASGLFVAAALWFERQEL
jgi:ABC-2 type transport system permease protein